jgi:hypothetical protein
MITVQAKDTSSPLSLAVDTKSSKSDTGTFAALLHSLGSKTEIKPTQNGPLMLHLNDKKEPQALKSGTKNLKTTAQNVKKQPEKSALLSLLKGEETKSAPAINPELLSAVDAKTLKSVMKDAKNYLKDQIKATNAFKKGEIKELPKTLQGLVEVAKKVGIDISKITIETVQDKNPKTLKTASKTEVPSDEKSTITDIKKDLHSTETENLKSVQKEPKLQTMQNDSKTEKVQTDLKTDKNIDTSKVQTPVTKNEQVSLVSDSKTIKSDTSKDHKTTKTDSQQSVQTPLEQKNQLLSETPIVEEKTLHGEESALENIAVQKNIPKQESPLATAQTQAFKDMPIFTVPQEVAAHSTAELVGTKQIKATQEQPTNKAPSLLSALLHGDKTPTIQTQTTDTKAQADSKIKTPSSVLSQLLHGENTQVLSSTEQIGSTNKTESISQNSENGLHVKQAESDLSVKMNEAKQMTKYLAEDIKQAIEDYKAPFTRIKVKLNPEKLGEVDLTVVQRGKNIHVNISSNNSAIASLAQNVNDLKVQLTQNGMNNATLNFNSSTDTQSQQQQEQQRQNGHQKEGAKKAYEAFNKDEMSEEVLSSLEIIVPRYI